MKPTSSLSPKCNHSFQFHARCSVHLGSDRSVFWCATHLICSLLLFKLDNKSWLLHVRMYIAVAHTSQNYVVFHCMDVLNIIYHSLLTDI